MTKWGPLKHVTLWGPCPCLSVKCVLVFCRHDFLCISMCVHASLRASDLEYTCVQLWLSSATLILYFNMFKLITVCVSWRGSCCCFVIYVSYMCVCVLLLTCVTCVNVRVCPCRSLWVCVCVVKTQPSVGALMSKCTLLSLLLGFM